MRNFPRWKSIAAFLRLEYTPGAIIPPFFGAVLGGVPFTAGNTLGLLALGITFHLFVGLLNDLVDLPLDRANPARAHYPLVKGTVSPKLVLFIILLQLPLAGLVIYFQLNSVIAYVSIGAAFAGMTIYNVWNKVTRFPIIIDFIQGIGFCMPVIYGAALSGSVPRVAWIAVIFGVIWMMLLNLLGGIRDLHCDLAFGVNTTPISLGAKPSGQEQVIPPIARNYGYALQLLTIAGGLLVFVWNDLNYPSWLNMLMLVACCIYGIVSMGLLVIFFKASSRNKPAMMSAGFLYLGISTLILFIVVSPLLPWWAILISMFFFVIMHRKYRLAPLLAFRFRHVPVLAQTSIPEQNAPNSE
ncbi:MAG: UbiA prenyltransferase family protein [Chitinophagaceae bacterium]